MTASITSSIKMNANKIRFSPGQCRIMFCMVVAVLALYVCRYDLPAGSGASIPSPAGAGERRPQCVIEIAGEVARPGIYSFSHGAGFAEAIRAAGGLKGSACVPDDLLRTAAVNGSLLSIGPDFASTAVTMMDPQKRFLYFVPFSINQASAEELVLVPGVGEKTARAIVCHRDRHGPFPRLESLREVPGIGRHTFERMKEFLVL